MELGIWIGNTTVATADYMVGVARTAEELGFDSVWMADHVVWPQEYASALRRYDASGRYPGTVETPAAPRSSRP